jgi:hypothetical protein
MIEVKLNIERRNLPVTFTESTPRMKEELKKTKTFMINFKLFQTIRVKMIKCALRRPKR